MFAFMLVLFVALSTYLGYELVRRSARRSWLLGGSLAVAAGAMAALAVVELIPHSYETLTHEGFTAQSAWFMVMAAATVGAVLTAFADKLHHGDHSHGPREIHGHSLPRTSYITGLIIGLHNIIEGFVLFAVAQESVTSGLVLAGAILVHNIAVGIAVAAPILAAGKPAYLARRVTFAVGLTLVLGGLIGWLVSQLSLDSLPVAIISAVMAGALFWTALSELMPMARLYGSLQSSRRWLCFAIGLVIVSASVILLGHDHAHLNSSSDHDHDHSLHEDHD